MSANKPEELVANATATTQPQPPAKYEFKQQKDFRLTREEIFRISQNNGGAGTSIAFAEREEKSKVHFDKHATSAHGVAMIANCYIPEPYKQSPDTRHNTMLWVNDEFTFNSLYRDVINKLPATDTMKQMKYCPVELPNSNSGRKYSNFMFKGCPLLHLEYFKKNVDQGQFDHSNSWEIARQENAKTQNLSDCENFEFSMPMLAFQTSSPNRKSKKEKKYDFIKIVVHSLNQGPMTDLERQFVIRVFRITNAKTHCSKRYLIGTYERAFTEASTLYRKYGHRYIELFDLENINEFNEKHTKPDDAMIRFVPDGYYKDHAYVHDRSQDKYVTMGEWRVIEKKKMKERIAAAKKVAKKRKVPLHRISADVVVEKQHEHKDVLDFFKSL